MKTGIVLLAGALLAANLEGAPAISAGGVVNAASYAYTGLPNAAIAQGSLFIVFGTGVGPSALMSGSYPLPAALGGTSLSVTVGGTTVTPYLVYTSSGQISAILPSNTPVGTGTITVSYNSQTSPSAPITVAANSVGIFSLNQAGSGPGIVTSANYVVAGLTSASQAGDTDIIWATGLGGASGGNEADGKATLNPVTGGVKVFVGGIAANVVAYARSAYAGLDQIAFSVPPGVSGCRVPVAVQTGNVVSNFVSMSIGVGSSTCSDVLGTGLTPAQLQQLQQQGTVSIGQVSLSRSTTSLAIPGFSTNTTSDIGDANFSKYTFAQYTTSTGGLNVTTYGACTVFSFSGTDTTPIDPVAPTPLDAGSAITISGPGGTKTLTKRSTGSYSATLGGSTGSSPLYLSAGTYTISGPGGANVGAFSTTLTVPAPLARISHAV